MNISVAHVPTEKGSRYLQQLCKHWAHKFKVDFTPTDGRIDFLDGRKCVLKAEADELIVTAFCPAEGMDQFQIIIEKHINRFAHKEGELLYPWAPAPE